MRFYELLENGEPIGRLLIDSDGTGYAVLDFMAPLRVIEKAPGESWRSKNLRLPPLGAGVSEGGAKSTRREPEPGRILN